MTNSRAHPLIGLACALALAAGTAALPAAAQSDGPAPLEPTPERAPHEERLQNMQSRMAELRAASDPRTFMPLMEAQMADMETMMKVLSEMCPRMTGTDDIAPTAAR